MGYQVLLDPKVVKFLETLPHDLSSRIKDKLRLLKENPFNYLEHYKGDDFYKLRIGDYRALIDVDIKNKLILVRVLDHRGRIYKRKHKYLH